MLLRQQVRFAGAPVAQVHPQFVHAARAAHQSIPMPQRRRQRERTNRFHLQMIDLREFVDARKRHAVRKERERYIG